MPHGSEQIVLADDALAVADRIFEEVEDLRLQRDQRPAAPQLAPGRIQREIFKGVEQCAAPLIGEESTSTRALTTLTFRTMPVKLVTAAMVSLRCTLVEILTPIKLPNSYSIFGLIAVAAGASLNSSRHICRRDGGEAADAGVRRPFAKGRSESYNFKRSLAVDSL